jgi:rubrerythrin
METAQIKELILQSLEHELGGVKLYTAAVEVAQNEGLKQEWTHFLDETRNHVRVLETVARKLGFDPEESSPGRKIVGALGASLLQAIEEARKGDPAAAELVACECVVLAETKDHLDWELLGQVAKKLKGEQQAALREAADEVEDQEDEHLYHTKGWCRELWFQSLGMKAVLPPPEVTKHVKSAIGAARAQHQRQH